SMGDRALVVEDGAHRPRLDPAAAGADEGQQDDRPEDVGGDLHVIDRAPAVLVHAEEVGLPDQEEQALGEGEPRAPALQVLDALGGWGLGIGRHRGKASELVTYGLHVTYR